MSNGTVETTRATPPPSAIELRGITKTYDGSGEALLTAVDSVDLVIASGEFVVISGRSGSGKTTLLNLMAGLAQPTAGEVTLEGADLWSMSDAQRCRARHGAVGFIFQFPSLMPTLTVLENVLLPTAFAGSGGRPDLTGRADELLELVGIPEKAAVFPRQLSAGQQQRVVLARALLNGPRIIMADEPTSNLDEQTEAEMMALFRSVHEATTVTIVMVTHALNLTVHGTRSIEMAGGRLVADRRLPDDSRTVTPARTR